ncbi:MAG: tetratricopeptide repeat protein, partial [Acidobacteriota bacterium]
NRALLIDPTSEEAKRGIIKANQEIAARSAVPDLEAIEKERLNYHLTKGTEYYDAEKFDEAIAEWQEALQIEPENVLAASLIAAAKRAKVDLLIERGHDAFFSGDVEGAIAIWEEARSIVPTSKVLADLLAEANEARHALEVGRLEAETKVETDKIDEFMRDYSLLPEGMSPDGLKKRDASERPPQRAPRSFGAREAIMKELSQPVAFEFECEPLRDVLRFLTTITGINILVDEDIFEEFGKEEDCFGNVVDREEIFVTIH